MQILLYTRTFVRLFFDNLQAERTHAPCESLDGHVMGMNCNIRPAKWWNLHPAKLIVLRTSTQCGKPRII